jgi:hypothetical protein
MESYNSQIKKWANDTFGVIRDTAYQMGIQHRPNSSSPDSSINDIKVRTYTNGGRISRIAYRIRRHLVFVHKGVGKGTPINKAGQTNRIAKPFFNEAIADNIEELADIVAQETGDELTENILIK